MKFGNHLSENILTPWRFEYIQYTPLKRELKSRQLDHPWNAEDEDWFSQTLSYELTKVLRFIGQKYQELDCRLHYCEQTLRNASTYWSVDGHYASIKDGLVEALYTLNDMDRFVILNRTGFQKMIKKHDKWTRLSSYDKYSTFDADFQHKQKLLDGLFVKLSQLLDVCRPRPPITTLLDDGKHRSLADDDNDDDAGAFERATEKYWVHPEHIAEVKAILLLNLPVLRYKADTPYDPTESAISSVYFDNKTFDLYTERLQRSEGAEAIRLRWYGPCTSKDIYVERKTHHAPWRANHASVKDRFRLDEVLVDDYLSGLYTPRMIADGLLQDKKKKSIAADAEFTAQGVIESVRKKHLEPMLRCYYNRTAFQHVNEPRLRVSLDTNLAFVREDGSRRRTDVRPQGHWRREDVGIDYPFRHLNAEDVYLFPYAILETKIQTHLGQRAPDWLTALTESHLVHPVPRFSKYLHGASRFFGARLSTMPWWTDELNSVDIRRRPKTSYTGLSRVPSLHPLAIQLDDEEYDSDKRNSSVATIVVDEDAAEEENEKLFARPPSPAAMIVKSKAPAFGRILPSRSRLRAKRIQGWLRKKIIRRWPTNSSSSSNAAASRRMAMLPPPSTSRVKAEPKTFFANERTFISWLQFCGLMLTISLSLINFGDHIAQLCGGLFLVIAAVLAIYSLWRYQYRAWQIRTRSTARYDDMYGPAILCVLIVAAIIVNFNLRFGQQTLASYGSSSAPITPFVTGEKV
ncbi:VTC domain-containing protein [Dichotomocladium elegans]|nr:VTC domain-containing protein [Dichotomocladium elegans]